MSDEAVWFDINPNGDTVEVLSKSSVSLSSDRDLAGESGGHDDRECCHVLWCGRLENLVIGESLNPCPSVKSSGVLLHPCLSRATL